MVQGGATGNPAPPLREYIHEPIEWSVHDWLLSGIPAIPTQWPIGLTSGLASDRDAHWKALCAEAGESVIAAWMDRASG
ncbi:MAG: hypothetical protein ABSB35_18665 [Bryobacteraceae bacterium]